MDKILFLYCTFLLKMVFCVFFHFKVPSEDAYISVFELSLSLSCYSRSLSCYPGLVRANHVSLPQYWYEGRVGFLKIPAQ